MKGVAIMMKPRTVKCLWFYGCILFVAAWKMGKIQGQITSSAKDCCRR